jgi:ribonuclease G
LFEHYHVQEQIQETLSSRVDLSGGGFVVIDETEALTVIDVNSGADVRHRNQQAAILNANLEAAKEIARQLRLRKISGIIIVDFIDMEESSAVQKLIDEVKKVLNEDRVSADFIDLTPLSLMEITRKCEGESLAGMLENADFDP